MKLVVLFLSLFSVSAHSVETRKHTLLANESVTIVCPGKIAPTQHGDSVACLCPEGTATVGSGKSVSCEARCEIDVVWGRGTPFELQVKNLATKKILFSEPIYDLGSVEVEHFLPMAIDVAKKSCYETWYKNKLIK